MPVKPIPDGYHSVTPYLVVKDGDKMLQFLQRGLGAELSGRHDLPNGRLMHAEVRIGDSPVMIGEAGDAHPPMPCMLYLYVRDCDAAYERALAAGAQSVREPADQFYGDRSGGVVDPEGNQWWFGTHVEDVSPEELERRAAQHRKG
jgi:uncharacterized glyoxalase superfamily protein PhnB